MLLPLLNLGLLLLHLLLLRGFLALLNLLRRHIGVPFAVKASIIRLAAVPRFISRPSCTLLRWHVLHGIALLVSSPALRRHVRWVTTHWRHVVWRVPAHISRRHSIWGIVLGRIVVVSSLHVLLILSWTSVHRGRSLLAASTHFRVGLHAGVVLGRHHVGVSSHLVRRRRVSLVLLLLLVGVGLSIASSLLLWWLLPLLWGSSIILLVVVHFIKM